MEYVDTAGTTRLSFLGRLRNRSAARDWAEFDGRYRALLYGYARRRGASHIEAEDIVQEVMMFVFKAMDRFQYDPNKGRFRGYLRTAVTHAMARRASVRARQEPNLDPEGLAALANVDDSADAEWEREWQLHRLRQAMRSIAGEFEPTTLEAFRLHVLAGWPVDDTARHLGLSPASVYQAKSRVLKRLKERIATADPIDDF